MLLINIFTILKFWVLAFLAEPLRVVLLIFLSTDLKSPSSENFGSKFSQNLRSLYLCKSELNRYFSLNI